MRRDLLVRLELFVPESPNTFPLLWKGADGRCLLWQRRHPPLHHVWGWCLGSREAGDEETRMSSTSSEQDAGFEQAL